MQLLSAYHIIYSDYSGSEYTYIHVKLNINKINEPIFNFVHYLNLPYTISIRQYNISFHNFLLFLENDMI